VAAPAVAASPVAAPAASRTDRPDPKRALAAETRPDPPALGEAAHAPPARDAAVPAPARDVPPAPTASPTPAPTAVVGTRGAPVPEATADEARSTGELRVRAVPWAEVTIDGMKVGTTPFRPIPLAPGAHTVLLVHPDYKPVERRVVVRAGETVRLDVDLAREP
jgi:serine/threonine-protein kinase